MRGQQTPTETEKGRITALRIVRDGWGFGKIRTSPDRVIAITGTLAGFNDGDEVEARGQWTTHKTYGQQFKVHSIRQVEPDPSDIAGFTEWLARSLPGIGPSKAKRLIEITEGNLQYTEQLLLSPADLAIALKLSPEKAAEVSTAYAVIQHERAEMSAFISYGLTNAQIARIREVWELNALERLQADPYALIDHVPGFGFKRADAIALNMGVPRDSSARIVRAIHYVLERSQEAGHTYLPAAKLCAMAADELEMDELEVRPHFKAAADGVRAINRAGYVFAPRMDAAEAAVAKRVCEFVRRAA